MSKSRRNPSAQALIVNRDAVASRDIFINDLLAIGRGWLPQIG
jgi:hypothetical protein